MKPDFEKFNEPFLEPILRKMRLSKILPSIAEFENAKVLDIGCGWEAKLLKEIEPFIAQGVGIDFKAPNIKTQKLHTFSYFFEPKPEFQNLDSEDFASNGGGGATYLKFKQLNLRKNKIAI